MVGKAAANKGQRSSNQRGHRPNRPVPPPSNTPRPPPPQLSPDARRNLRPRRGRVPFFDGYDSSSSEEEDERGRRKLKLVLKLPHSPHSPATISRPAPDAATPVQAQPSAAAASSSASASSTSFSYDAEEDAVKPLKKRRFNGCDDGVTSDGSGHHEDRKKYGVRRSKISILGTLTESLKGTALPGRKALELILDKLQKKDTYGVYAEPVDPEELPDYREVIEHPMDFGTIRKKLARKAYRTFEQFEDDVFLICSNAMQYNAPHTIYFRQARAIEEMARKNFHILKADAKCIETERKSEEKIRFSSMEKKPLKKSLYRAEQDSSMEKKPLKKSLYRAEQEPPGSDISSNATLASTGVTCTRLSIEEPSAFEKIATANGLSMRANAVGTGLSAAQVNADVKPANSNGLSRPRVNAAEKHANSNGFGRAQAVEKSVAANELSKARAKAVQKPATSTGVCMGQTTAFDKRTTTNGLSKARPSAADKPAITNGLSPTQAPSVEKPAIVDELCTTQTNAFEKPETADGSSMAQADAVEKSAIVNSFADCSSSLGESKSEKADEFSAKCSPSKLGRKPLVVDENRRTTYKSGQQLVLESDLMFDSFESETKQLLAVGFQSEYSYARSLARFAAFLGPVGWDIASKRIEKALPAGIKFGPGWVGEYEPLPTPVLYLQNHTRQHVRNISNLQCRVESKTNEESDRRSKATKNDDSKNTQFGLNSNVISGMPHRAGNPPERTISGEQKQRLFGVSAETQSRITYAMLQQHKDQAGIHFTRVYNNGPLQVGLGNPSSVSSIPVEKALQRSEFHSEAHKQRWFDVSSVTEPRITNAMLLQQKDQAAIDSNKACYNASEQVGVCNSSSVSSISVETALRRPQYHSAKQGLSDVSAETQPGITNMMLHQQKDQVASKVCNNASEQVRVLNPYSVNGASEQVRVLNPYSVNDIRVETASERDEYHSQAQKQGFGISAETHPRISNVILQHNKDQVIDFVKAYNHVPDQIRLHNLSPVSSIPVETTPQRTDCRSEVTTSSWGMNSRNRNQVHPDRQKQLDTRNLQCEKDALVLTVGGLGNGKVRGLSHNNSAITSLGFMSNQQSGVTGCSSASGSCVEANDFREMGLSGKNSNQPNYLSAGNYSVKQVMSPIRPSRRDDTGAATVSAAGAWMSFGASTECRPVYMGYPNTQIASASFNDSSWKAPTAAARNHGDSMTRPLSQILPQQNPLLTEESHVQNRGLVFFPQLIATDMPTFHGRSPWQGLVSHARPRQKDMHPPDLNIGFQPPGSPIRPSSNILVDTQQPDLALQL